MPSQSQGVSSHSFLTSSYLVAVCALHNCDRYIVHNTAHPPGSESGQNGKHSLKRGKVLFPERGYGT